MKNAQTDKTATASQKSPALPYDLHTIHAKLAYFSPEERALIVHSVNNAEALAEALRDVDLRTTQARIASGIGKRKNQTEFLLGELERIASVAREALARWEAK